MENILYEIVEKAKKYDNLLLLNKSKKELHCSFCGKSESSVKKLIAANDGICICNECVDLCYEILYKDSNKIEITDEIIEKEIKEFEELEKLIK